MNTTMKRDDPLLKADFFEEEDSMEGKYLTFHLSGEQYGIPISYVIEIICLERITEVPDLPSYIKGVINLRGQVIPATDVGIRFGFEPRPYDEKTCIIVVKHEGISVGLIVDDVAEVVEIPDSQIDPPPSIERNRAHAFISGMGKVGEEVKLLLDIGKVLSKAGESSKGSEKI